MLKKKIILNVIIIVAAIICFSPGLLGLFSSDSVISIIFGIIVALALSIIFFVGNLYNEKKPVHKRVNKENITNIDKASALLKSYYNGEFFGKTAKLANEQLKRLVASLDKTKIIISEKFEPNSMSWEKYNSAIEIAINSAIDNIVSMANRMQVFDEDTYKNLQDYKNDDIPDDVQEQQIELYKTNLERIKSSIALNEQLLLKMDTLLLELSTSSSDDNSNDILDEIEQLTKEVKLYK